MIHWNQSLYKSNGQIRKKLQKALIDFSYHHVSLNKLRRVFANHPEPLKLVYRLERDIVAHTRPLTRKKLKRIGNKK